MALLAGPTSVLAIVVFRRPARPPIRPHAVGKASPNTIVQQSPESVPSENTSEAVSASPDSAFDAQEAATMRGGNARLQQVVREFPSEMSGRFVAIATHRDTGRTLAVLYRLSRSGDWESGASDFALRAMPGKAGSGYSPHAKAGR